VRHYTSALLLPLLLLAACRLEPNPRPTTLNVDSAARADIRSTMDGYREALLQNDARAVAAFFTVDARVHEPDAPDIVGSTGIREALQHFFAQGNRITDITIESESIDVDGPLAWDIGTYEESFRAAAGEDVTIRGRYVIRWRRGEEARWRIDRFMVNHLPPGDTARAAPR
jgi:uncharacterized protein (TIGR02246 family)